MKTLVKPQAENYMVLHPISWETFVRISEELSPSPRKRLAYNRELLQIYCLNLEQKTYEEISKSLAFPFLDISLIPQWLQQRLIIGETATLKQVRQGINNI